MLTRIYAVVSVVALPVDDGRFFGISDKACVRESCSPRSPGLALPPRAWHTVHLRARAPPCLPAALSAMRSVDVFVRPSSISMQALYSQSRFAIIS